MSEERRNRQRYAIQKLFLAVNTLVGTGSIHARLAEAYLRHLATVSPGDFPETLGEEFKGILTVLSREEPVGYEGQSTLRSPINAMSEEEATLVARQLVSLFYDLIEYYLDGT